MKTLNENEKKDSSGGESNNSDVTEKRSSYPNVSRSMLDPLKRRHHDQKVIGLADGIRRSMGPELLDSLEGSRKIRYKYNHRECLNRSHKSGSLEDDEKYARSKVEKRPIVLFLIGYYTACKIFIYYLISLTSILTIGLSVGLTIFWYEKFQSVS